MKTNTARETDAKLVTHEGAQAKRITVEQQLRRSVLACLLWEKEFYEEGAEIATRIQTLADGCSMEFVSALAIEARNVHGLRHAPLWLTLNLVKRGGSKIVSKTIENVIRRADELTEFVALYWADNGAGSAGTASHGLQNALHNNAATTVRKNRKPLSAQMKRGLAAAFVKFDAYQLAKYDRANKVRLRDVLFLSHAKPKDQVQAAIWKQLIDNKMSVPDTWEVALSSGADKKETFTRLLGAGKLGYLALIRNLRNMNEAGVDRGIVEGAILERRGAALVLPFRFIAAAKEAPMFESALDIAMQAGMADAPKLKGKSVIVLDVSGSMASQLSRKSTMSRMDAGAALCIVIRGQCEEAVVYATAGNDATRIHKTKLVPSRSGMALRDALIGTYRELGGGGIFLKPMLEQIKSEQGSADRVIVVTDEQDCAVDSKDSPTLAAPFGSKANYLLNVASAKNGIGYGGKWTHIDGFSQACVNYMLTTEASQ